MPKKTLRPKTRELGRDRVLRPNVHGNVLAAVECLRLARNYVSNAKWDFPEDVQAHLKVSIDARIELLMDDLDMLRELVSTD